MNFSNVNVCIQIDKNAIVELHPHPTYSPDLALSDFFYFPFSVNNEELVQSYTSFYVITLHLYYFSHESNVQP